MQIVVLPMHEMHSPNAHVVSLGATVPQQSTAVEFMRLRCRVMEKRHQNVLPHNSVCDDLYHACTLAWGKICALFTRYWKVLRH